MGEKIARLQQDLGEFLERGIIVKALLMMGSALLFLFALLRIRKVKNNKNFKQNWNKQINFLLFYSITGMVIYVIAIFL